MLRFKCNTFLNRWYRYLFFIDDVLFMHQAFISFKVDFYMCCILGNEVENTFLKKIKLYTYSKRQQFKEHFSKKKKVSQYLEKRQNDVNIKISFFLEQILKFQRNWGPKLKKSFFYIRKKFWIRFLTKNVSVLT